MFHPVNSVHAIALHSTATSHQEALKGHGAVNSELAGSTPEQRLQLKPLMFYNTPENS